MIRDFSKEEMAQLRVKFKKAQPFSHVVVNDIFLDPERLRTELAKEQFFKKDEDLFSFHQTHNLFFSKNPLIKHAVSFFSSKEFSSFISALSGIKLKPGAADVSGALYQKADYLLCHDDQVENRKVAFILYLSPSFSVQDGGALSFFSEKNKHPDKKVVSYPPVENSMMIFAVSEKSWHEVEESLSDRKRYTIGGWLH